MKVNSEFESRVSVRPYKIDRESERTHFHREYVNGFQINRQIPEIKFINCNHKGLGIYYLLSAFIFGISGTLISVLIRIELYSTGNRIISPENQNFYNISITLHGFIMIFFSKVDDECLEAVVIHFWDLLSFSFRTPSTSSYLLVGVNEREDRRLPTVDSRFNFLSSPWS